jgi:ParB-like chromosome segregation protein Spo0J
MIEKNIEKQKPKAYTDKIPVYCAFDELVDPRSLRGNPKNPNVHPKTQVTLLAQIIERQGWRAPITVSKRSGLIVRGHGRLMAALEKNLTKAPVDYQSYDSEDEEYADMLADNRLAELAETDEDALGELLGELEKSEIPLWLTGYTDIDLEAYITETVKDDGEPGGVNDVDSIPDMPVVSMTQPGDLYILDGKHRIFCGDCTND